MQESIDLCNIIATNSRGTYVKYPKLVELYIKLFGAPPVDSLHNSRHDILATLRCFLKMRFQYDQEQEEKEEEEEEEIIEMDEWLARQFNALHIVELEMF